MSTASQHIAAAPPTPSVAVVGAGITGLAAAHELVARGIDVVVHEAGDRPGGPIRSFRDGGYLAEEGPNTLLAPDPELRRWIGGLGLADQCLESSPAASRRFLVRHGRPIALPGNPLGWITSPLFSWPGKVRILGDLFLGRPDPGLEESVAGFVRRRLGPEMLERAINPLIAGIYAGDPERLSLREAFPRLHEVERAHRSLLLGQILVDRQKRRRGEVSRTKAPKLSFRDGLESLVLALASRLGDRLRLGSPVTRVARRDDGWEVTAGTPPTTRNHSAVLLTAPARRLARIDLGTPTGDSLGWLDSMEHAPITTLVLGFRRADVAHRLDGFGVLVPEVEKIPILGVLFNSSLFPNRAPEGHVTLTCYLGGSRDPELAVAPLDRQLAVALGALGPLLGVTGRPTFIHHRSYQPGIPQYGLGFGRFRQRFDDLERSNPGLHFAGQFRHGIALFDCLTAGREAAARIGSQLPGRPPTARPDAHPDNPALSTA